MTDKALEAALEAWFANTAKGWSEAMQAAISAYLSALPGEAEVVLYRHRDPTDLIPEEGQWLYSEVDDGGEPLVTLASLQAMQARAEAAERERDEAQDRASAWAKEEGQRQIELGTAISRAEAADARLKDAMGLLDHLIDWIVHDCGAEPPFTSEQDETYTALTGDSNG